MGVRESQPELNNIVMISELYHVSTDYLLKDIIVNDQKRMKHVKRYLLYRY